MILVFAPNPALERVALVETYQAGVPQKPMRVTAFTGGAGLRAANVIQLLGGEVQVVGFAGGRLGALLREGLDRQRIPYELINTATQTRGDFLVLDKERGIVNEVPENAPVFTVEEAERLLAALQRHLDHAALLLIADGARVAEDAQEAATDLFDRALVMARDAKVPVLADVSGAVGFEAVVTTGGVWLLRINYRCLQTQTARSLQHDSAIVAEARSLIERGIENVVVTIGDEGALLVNATGAWRVKAPVVSHFNPTGSGETLSGALAYHYGLSGGNLLDAVRYGCAAASVNVTHDEPGWATPGEVNVLYPRTIAGPVTLR